MGWQGWIVARRDQNAEILLDAILSHLRSRFSLNERTCYETLDPFPEDFQLPPGGPIVITVAMGVGQFPAEYQIGGGIQQVNEELTWAVNLYCRINLDPVNRDPQALRRILGYKKQLLAALASVDFTDDGGQYFLRDQILITAADPPQWVANKGVARISVYFRASFDWDLEESSSSTGNSSASSSSSLSSTSSSSSLSTSSSPSSSTSSGSSDSSSTSSSSSPSSAQSSESSSSSTSSESSSSTS